MANESLRIKRDENDPRSFYGWHGQSGQAYLAEPPPSAVKKSGVSSLINQAETPLFLLFPARGTLWTSTVTVSPPKRPQARMNTKKKGVTSFLSRHHGLGLQTGNPSQIASRRPGFSYNKDTHGWSNRIIKNSRQTHHELPAAGLERETGFEPATFSLGS